MEIRALKPFFTWLDRTTTLAWILAVSGISLAGRLALLFFYQPVAYNDTPSYRRMANAILAGWKGFDGTRTPGYSLFLALVGPDQRVWLAQLAMGIIITFLFFYIGWQLSGLAWFGGLAALAYTLNPGQFWFESNLLSETPTTFWVTLSLAGVILWIYHPRYRSIWLALGMGITTSLAWLTRPLFIFLPFWLAVFMFGPDFIHLIRRQAGRLPWIKLAAYLLPVFLILGSWLGFIHKRFHQWGMDTMTGYHLIQHTGVFFEHVPDDYAALRDTYLEYRDAHIAQYGTQANTIWEAIPAMQNASGESFYGLSRLLTKISVQLILAHPDLYAKNLVQGWWYFWRGPVYWSPELFRLAAVLPALNVLVLFGRLAVFAFNLLFLLTTALAVFWRRLRADWQIPPALWCLAGAVWGASLLQTIMDHGDNPRFLIPLQTCVLVWVLYLSLRTLKKERIRQDASAG
jgi:4-amino-4-deoxy-L-arabinose transferase-like glycosyltransferase